MDIFYKCKQLCEARGLELRAACAEAGVPYDTVIKWGSGNYSKPQMRNVRALAGFLGVHPIALLDPALDTSGDYYQRYGVVITDNLQKLKIILANSGLSIAELSRECSMDQRSIYRMLAGENGISLDKCERLSKVVGVPMYVFLDERVPLRVKGYLDSEVISCSAEVLARNARALHFIGHRTVNKKFNCEGDASMRALRRIISGDRLQVNTLQRLAQRMGIGMRDLLTDYTTSENIHADFIAMTCLKRMKFMMALKGVTPDYVAETLCWDPETVWSGKPNTMRREVPYIMAQYFKCPNAWFTKEHIELQPRQTLVTEWNTVI